MVAKCFARCDVGQMYLDKRYGDTSEGVSQRDAGVRQPPRIDHDESYVLVKRGVDPVNQSPFAIALKCSEGRASFLSELLKTCIDTRNVPRP
jgi:hypothetical protein